MRRWRRRRSRMRGRRLRLRWNVWRRNACFRSGGIPNARDRGVDYSAEPTTLIEFVLTDAQGGVMLTVTESGFDQIPLARRAQAFTANEQGWGMVVKLIETYLAGGYGADAR